MRLISKKAEKPPCKDQLEVTITEKSSRPLSATSSISSFTHSSDGGSASAHHGPVDLDAAFSHLSLSKSSTQKPTTDQAIAHLKLLECFRALREDISNRDGVFGINDTVAWKDGIDPQTIIAKPKGGQPYERGFKQHLQDYKTALETQKDLLKVVREMRWSVYVSRAVDRYEKWWSCASTPGFKPEPCVPLKISDFGRQNFVEDMLAIGETFSYSKHDLPPIDVLLVWHSHRLNPRAYLEDCLRSGRMESWNAPFPWEAINACIDNTSFRFEPSPIARQDFITATGRAWDNLDEHSSAKEIRCPNCGETAHYQWSKLVPIPKLRRRYDPPTLDWEQLGLAGAKFKQACLGCSKEINHDLLRVQKFYIDFDLLLKNDFPMAGTLLRLEGTAQSVAPKDPEKDQTLFANRFLKAVYANMPLPESMEGMSIDTIRSVLTHHIGARNTIQDANKHEPMKKALEKTERISIRRMLSRYAENSSVFALDLVGAVVRQGGFIEKMHDIDWLHSPTLTHTATRLITKYEHFFHLMSLDLKRMRVPTLDVDLAWHTHQLSPASYYTFSLRETKTTFIDHDDKIAESRLNDAFVDTCKAYYKLYKEPYSECSCWYCEAIREHLSGLFSRHKPPPKGTTTDAALGPHLSAHSAVVGNAYDQICQRDVHRYVTAWSIAVQRRKEKKKKRKSGVDEEEEETTDEQPTGPLIFPYLALSTPCEVDSYAANPACTAGADCAAGSCGGMAGAGACVASGFSTPHISCGASGAGCSGGGSAIASSGGGGCGGGGSSGGGGGGCGGGGGF